MPPVQYACPRIDNFDESTWDGICNAMQKGLVLPMIQAWLDHNSPNFAPCQVFIGWQPESLIILGELIDNDIQNSAKEFNEPTFMHGDVFEMFLRPHPQLAYYEFHVSPFNQKFQLRIASAKAFREMCTGKMHKPKEHFAVQKIPFEAFESKTVADQSKNEWRVFARIPFVNIVETEGTFGVGSKMLLSCSRYDYTTGIIKPVLSSTSPHKEVSFHRQEEWAVLTLA